LFRGVSSPVPHPTTLWGPIFIPLPHHTHLQNDPTNVSSSADAVFMIKCPHSPYEQILTPRTPLPIRRPLHHLRPTQDSTPRGQQPRPPRTKKGQTSFLASRPHNRDHDPTSTQTHTPRPTKPQLILPRPHKRTTPDPAPRWHRCVSSRLHCHEQPQADASRNPLPRAARAR
jgi:hypothetical protein